MPTTRARLWADRGDAHLAHQGGQAPTSDARILGPQRPAQHARAGKREVQVQRVHPAHQREIEIRDGTGLVVDRPATDPQDRRLARERQGVRSVDHRLALSRQALPSACSKNIILQRQLADLGVQGLDINGRFRAPTAFGEHVGGTGKQLVLPRGHLRGMQIKALRQIGERAIAFDGGEGDLGLEGRGMVPTGTFRQQELLG